MSRTPFADPAPPVHESAETDRLVRALVDASTAVIADWFRLEIRSVDIDAPTGPAPSGREAPRRWGGVTLEPPSRFSAQAMPLVLNAAASTLERHGLERHSPGDRDRPVWRPYLRVENRAWVDDVLRRHATRIDVLAAVLLERGELPGTAVHAFLAQRESDLRIDPLRV